MSKGVKKPRKLTLKQKKFTAEYLKSGNGTQAAIKAGYSKNSAQEIASENLSKPIIQQAVQSAAEKLGINPEYILNNFKRVSEVNSKLVTKTLGNGDNVYVVEEMVDVNAVLKSNEMMGKHVNLFTDKKEIEVIVEEKTDCEKRKDIAKRLILALQNPDIIDD